MEINDFVLCAGATYEWIGLPGQERPDAVIEINSMTASCCINATILRIGERPHLVTIALSDLVAAMSIGALKIIEKKGLYEGHPYS